MSGSERNRWLVVVAFTAIVYSTLPVAPAVWRSFARSIAPWDRHAAAVALVAVAAWVAWRCRARLAALDAKRWLGLLGIGAVYVAEMARTDLTPAEKTHFLSYGVLAWLVWRALVPRRGGAGGMVAALTLTALIGLGDEGIQYLLPRRFFEWKDVWLNALSAGLAIGVIALLRDPGERS